MNLKLFKLFQILGNVLKFNGILGKTEKYWEGNSKEKKKNQTFVENETNKSPLKAPKEKNESNNFNSTSNNSQTENINDESLKDTYFISLEEQKLNNLIQTIENKFGIFYNFK